MNNVTISTPAMVAVLVVGSVGMLALLTLVFKGHIHF